jgi:hypothetical protein
MKYFFMVIHLIIIVFQSFAQDLVKKQTSDFSYIYLYNAPTQSHSLSFYPLDNSVKKIDFLQIWAGNKYRDLSKCGYYFPNDVAFSIDNKHPKNLTGKPPIQYKGRVLLVYRVNGKVKYQVLKNPQILNQSPITNKPPHARTPPFPEMHCEY